MKIKWRAEHWNDHPDVFQTTQGLQEPAKAAMHAQAYSCMHFVHQTSSKLNKNKQTITGITLIDIFLLEATGDTV